MITIMIIILTSCCNASEWVASERWENEEYATRRKDYMGVLLVHMCDSLSYSDGPKVSILQYTYL